MEKQKVPILANNIKTLRINSGMTLEHCAKELGLNGGKTTFYAYEIGKAEPSLSTLIKISHLFRTDINDILGVELQKENKPVFNKCKQCSNDVKSERGRPLSSNYCNKCYWG